MRAITFKVPQKSGDYVRPTVVPANHAGEPRFGLLDITIVAAFLGCAGGLIYLLVVG